MNALVHCTLQEAGTLGTLPIHLGHRPTPPPPPPPAWNECIFLFVLRMVGLGQEQAWRRTGLGVARSSFPSPLKGPLFQMMRVRIRSPKLNLGHLTPTASLTSLTTQYPGDQQSTNSTWSRAPSFPLAARLLPSPRLAGAQPQLPPPQPCGGTAHRGLGGVGRSTAPRRGVSGRAGEAEGSLWNVSVGSTRPGKARRGLAASSGRPFLIGRARAPAPPPGSGCGRGPGQSLRRAELGARRAAAAQVSFHRRRDSAGGLGWVRGCPRTLFSRAPPFPLEVRGQRLRCPDRVSSRTPAPCTPLVSPGLGGHRRGVGISEPYPGTSPELAASQSSRAWERGAWEGPRSR